MFHLGEALFHLGESLFHQPELADADGRRRWHRARRGTVGW